MAANDTYKEIAIPDTRTPRKFPCASCAMSGAVLAILDSEFGPAGIAKTTLASAGTADVVSESMSIRDDVNGSSFTRVQRVGYEKPINVDEEVGSRIGMQALTHYRALN